MEIIETIWEILFKAIKFLLWVLVGVLVLPCVFVSGILYPKWEKWGEKF